MIAGSSRGRADHTAAVLERTGELVAHGVALRPAHPVALGVVEATPVIGIPGYPVAAAMAFERFARPLIALLLGALPEDAPLIRVRLTGEVRAKRGVEAYVPLVLSAGTDLPTRCRRAARAAPCAGSPARTRCSARASRTACCRPGARSTRASCDPGRARATEPGRRARSGSDPLIGVS